MASFLCKPLLEIVTKFHFFFLLRAKILKVKV